MIRITIEGRRQNDGSIPTQILICECTPQIGDTIFVDNEDWGIVREVIWDLGSNRNLTAAVTVRAR